MFPARDHVSCGGEPVGRGAAANRRAAFTLIELLVTLVIISILAGLSLAGLAGARQRGKIDKTRSTIRKIDAIIRPMYDSYRTRRVDVSSLPNPTSTQCSQCYSAENNLRPTFGSAWKRLVALRKTLVVEMPDCWSDVAVNLADLPTYAATGSAKAYHIAATNARRVTNDQSEPLFLVMSRSGFEPDALELFRADEVGDTDSDGAPEFVDGWGKPIVFWRWAPGFVQPLSVLQVANADTAHDPMDPLKVDATGYALVPLIVSGGPDEVPGLTPPPGWLAMPGELASLLANGGSNVGAPVSVSSNDHLDNISNHDLVKK